MNDTEQHRTTPGVAPSNDTRHHPEGVSVLLVALVTLSDTDTGAWRYA